MSTAVSPSRPVLVSLGEILWDIYPDGKKLGGAPLNVAAHAARLGFDCRLISAVGDDDLGRRAHTEAMSLGIDMSLTRWHPHLPTGTVDVVLDAHANPTFAIRRPAAWEEPELTPAQCNATMSARPAWLVCGTLQQTCPMARAIRLRLEGIPLFYDVNLRPGFEDPETVEELLRAAAFVKCNEGELAWIVRHLGLDDGDVLSLQRRIRAQLICVTRGQRGCLIATKDELLEIPAPRVAAIDSVGAGDAFSAALLHCITTGSTLKDAVRMANALGALVASRRGAVPEWSAAELSALIEQT